MEIFPIFYSTIFSSNKVFWRFSIANQDYFFFISYSFAIKLVTEKKYIIHWPCKECCLNKVRNCLLNKKNSGNKIPELIKHCGVRCYWWLFLLHEPIVLEIAQKTYYLFVPHRALFYVIYCGFSSLSIRKLSLTKK